MLRRTHGAAATVAITSALLWPCALAPQSTAATEPEVARSLEFELSIKSIMRGPELVGEGPVQVRWTDDSQWVYFRWRPGGQAWNDSRDLYRVRADGGEPERLSDEAADSLAWMFSPGDLSRDRRYRVTAVEGDLLLVDRSTMEVRRLTETAETERAPRFSADGSAVFFMRGDNLFSLGVSSGSVKQLTDIRSGPEPKDAPDAEGQKGFLERQQEELFEHIRTDQQAKEEREAREDRRKSGRPEPVYLNQGERLQELLPGPDGAFVAVTTNTPPKDPRRAIVPDWVTASGYTEDIDTRTKVGDEQGTPRVGILAAETGEMTWLDLVDNDDSDATKPSNGDAEGRTDRPASDPEDQKLAQAGFVGWNDAGTYGLVFAVSFDFKDWRLYSLEAATGKLTLLDTLHDEAWVGGPCFFGCAGWVPDSDRAYYVSERSGYAHVYTAEADGAQIRSLTSGDWEVRGVTLPEDRSSFLLHTSETSPFDTHVYRMAFDGSGRERITNGEGRFNATLSPDGRRMALVASTPNRPPELFLAPPRAGAEREQVTVSPTPEWLSFPWIEPEIVRVPASDGVPVPARIYRPSDLRAESNGAAVVFVHGAGYLQNVHNGWSGYYREYMFHHFLAANGYTVLDIDYRGSAGHGRDWRTGIYRWMGGKDLSDQVDGARYLVAEEGIEADRIGIYGGSYGGFITLMALFTEPDVFAAGGALRSVTDWAHYNHWYTSRILNQPQDDLEAYRRSSPIYFAEGLEGHLLIAHGMVDTNVHFSDVVRLAQRLIELGKENWEMAVYPVENHGFVEPTSWTDEYRRIYELFERATGERH